VSAVISLPAGGLKRSTDRYTASGASPISERNRLSGFDRGSGADEAAVGNEILVPVSSY
jgi:hypothetical protein